MSIRVSSQAVPAAVLKISVLPQTSSVANTSDQMNLPSVFTRQVHRSTWSLWKMVRLLTWWKPVRSWRLPSADRASVLGILRQTMHFPSVTLPVTSRTVKEASCRVDRSHLLPLWMHVPLPQLLRTKVSLLRQQILILNTRTRLTTLIPEFTPTVYLTATALLILRLRSNSDRTSKTGRQWALFLRIWSWRSYLRSTIRLQRQTNWSRPARLLLIVPTRLDLLNLHFPERILPM